MAITTLDDLLAGMLPTVEVYKTTMTAEAAGLNASSFLVAGSPGAAVPSVAGVAGEALTSYAGQVPFPASVGGQNIHLARLYAAVGSGIGSVTLMDRLWHNSGLSVTSTASQTVDSVAWPARDDGGSTNGVGVNIALEQQTTGGAGTPTFTVTYTNSAGTTGRTGIIGPVATTLTAGTFYKMTMQAGDRGVRSVQSIQSSATMTSGTYSLVAYRTIAFLGTPGDNDGYDRDAVALGFPRVHDSSVPFLVLRTASTTLSPHDVAVTWAQG